MCKFIALAMAPICLFSASIAIQALDRILIVRSWDNATRWTEIQEIDFNGSEIVFVVWKMKMPSSRNVVDILLEMLAKTQKTLQTTQELM
jgi:cytidylate kinase